VSEGSHGRIFEDLARSFVGVKNASGCWPHLLGQGGTW
jgi:hypothetical protein